MANSHELHFATIWENVSDAVPNNIAVISGNKEKTWREYEIEASKLAAFLDERGIKENVKVGLYLHNCNEYLEAQFGIFKVMGVPVNVNYRYQAGELKYLLDNSDCEAVFFQSCYADQVNEIVEDLPKIKTWIQVGEESPVLSSSAFSYSDVISAYKPMPRIKRNEDNIYMIYTGGTTAVSYTHLTLPTTD